jgi:hypothetical protein
VVAVAGAAVGVWLAIGADLVSPQRGTVRESARPAEIAPAASDTETATGAAPGAPTPAAPTETSPTGDPPAVAGEEPPAPANIEAANPPASGSDPTTGSPPAGDPAIAAKPPDPDGDASAEPAEPKKKPTKAGVQDARAKGKPRGRGEAKRTDARRGQKPDAKEQPWNDDSPFLPVTPKR